MSREAMSRHVMETDLALYAAGDLPFYFVMAAAASREGVSTWKQDLLATGAFYSFWGLVW